MKGLLFVFIIYLVVLLTCFLVKLLFNMLKKNKKSGKITTQKIYYVENVAPKKRKVKIASPKIQIKGTIIEKDELEN